MSKSILRKLLCLFAFGFLATSLGLISDLTIKQRQAEKLLSTLANAQIGISGQAEMQRELEQFRYYSTSSREPDLQTLSFTNRWTTLLGLTPSKIMTVSVPFCRGVLLEKSFAISGSPRTGVWVRERVRLVRQDKLTRTERPQNSAFE